MSGRVKLDQFDIKILIALQENGQLTKVKLAERIGLSVSPCWERVKRLEQAGFIKGYHADVDLSLILRHSIIMVEVSLSSHRTTDFERFEQAIHDVPEIVECYATGGGIDYVMKVVALDINQYQRMIDQLLQQEIGIDRYFTYVVTKPIKLANGYPIATLLKQQKAE